MPAVVLIALLMTALLLTELCVGMLTGLQLLSRFESQTPTSLLRSTF